MKFEKITLEDLKSTHLNNIVIEKKDANELKFSLNMYWTYRKLFTEYIIQKIELVKYDEELFKSELNFLPQIIEKMDFYQYFSNNILKFFYLRNNIYIEKLNEMEIQYLKGKTEKEDEELDENAIQFIEKTYKKIIQEDVLNNGKTYTVMYGPDSKSFMASNNSIVIGFRYDEFNYNGLNDLQWNELNNKQREFLFEFLNNMKQKIKLCIDVPIEIIKYNDFSVDRLKKL